jgi:cyclopropane fatty-acyl-phospholipid synthase-like methyltransferase
MQGSVFAERYDEVIREPRMRDLYGDSGYFNVGYWEDGCTDLPRACDRMVDLLAAAIPQDARRILDIGCGIGAGSARLTSLFPQARVIAGNLSHWQLTQARRRGLDAPVVMDAARLPIASDALDAVVAVESAQHFDTRERFFGEARRVLRPNGSIALADMLFRDRQPIGAWMLPPGNQISTAEDYSAQLAAAGFGDIRVTDVTDRTWRPFCAAMRTVFRGSEEIVDAYEQSLGLYLIATARKA